MGLNRICFFFALFVLFVLKQKGPKNSRKSYASPH